jgi:hypothetical protein
MKMFADDMEWQHGSLNHHIGTQQAPVSFLIHLHNCTVQHDLKHSRFGKPFFDSMLESVGPQGEIAIQDLLPQGIELNFVFILLPVHSRSSSSPAVSVTRSCRSNNAVLTAGQANIVPRLFLYWLLATVSCLLPFDFLRKEASSTARSLRRRVGATAGLSSSGL